MALTIGGTSVNPGSWSAAVSKGLRSVASGGSNVEGITRQEAKTIQKDIEANKNEPKQEQSSFQSLKSYEQSPGEAPPQTNQFLNQIKTPQQAALAADYNVIGLSLGVSSEALATTQAGKDIMSKIEADRGFREKRAEQVIRGGKLQAGAMGATGSDALYPTGTFSPVSSERLQQTEAVGGNFFLSSGELPKATERSVGGSPTFNIPKPVEGNNIVTTKADMYSQEPQKTFSVQGAPVFGGMSSVAGYEMQFVERAPIMSAAPSKSKYGYSFYQGPAVGKKEAGIFTPSAQYTTYTGEATKPYEIEKAYSARLETERTALSGEGVVGGVRTASGQGNLFIQTQPVAATERKSIFNFGNEEYKQASGNKEAREFVSGLVGFGAERALALSENIYPPLKYIPKKADVPIVGEISARTLSSGAASGAILVSPFGAGEVIQTGGFGTPTQKSSLAFEIATMDVFAVVGGTKGKIQPERTVSTTGMIGELSVVPKADETKTFRINADAASGYKIQSTTTAKLTDEIVIGGKTRDIVDIGDAKLITTQTPLGAKAYMTESIFEKTELGKTRTTAGRELIPIKETPTQAMGSREVNLFGRIPESKGIDIIGESGLQRDVLSQSSKITMSTRNVGGMVETSVYRGKDLFGGSMTNKMGEQTTFGLTQKGQQIFSFGELGRIMGTSEVPIKVNEAPSITFKPEYKTVPKGNLMGAWVDIVSKPSGKLPKELPIGGLKFESGGSYSLESYKPYKISELTPQASGGQRQILYPKEAYDKPISISEIQNAVGQTRIEVSKPSKIFPTGSGGKTIDFSQFTTEIKSQGENAFGRYAPPKTTGRLINPDYAQYSPQLQKQYQYQLTSQATSQLTGQMQRTSQTQAEAQIERTSQLTGQMQMTGQLEQVKQITGQTQTQKTSQTTMQMTTTASSFGFNPNTDIIPKKPIKEEPPWKPGGGFGDFGIDMSGDFGFGKPGKKKKGAYRPSFIATQLGLKMSKREAYASEKTGISIRGLIGKGKKR